MQAIPLETISLNKEKKLNFTAFGLNSDLLTALEELKFETPTPVQEGAIPLILADEKDLIVLAQTGTGKTAAYGLPLLEKLDFSSHKIQTLILCPTRELCLQITKDLRSFSKHLGNPGITAVYGGASYNTQISQLKRGARVVAATPGRLVDLMEKGLLNLEDLKYLVLDEADEMLNFGFREELEKILKDTNRERRTLLFSATFSPEVAKIAYGYMNNPKELSYCKKNQPLNTIEHLVYVVREENKYQALKRLADFHPEIYGIIFCRTRMETKELAARLITDGYSAEALHGDLSQDQREYVMGKFRHRGISLLLATDIAARGLDIPDLTHVIHYDIPNEPDRYTHRSGRTGRAGKTGISLVLAAPKERMRIRRIETSLGKRFTEKPLPTKQEIEKQQLLSFLQRLKDVPVDDKAFLPHLPEIMDSLEGLDREEIVKRFLSLEFSQLLEFYRDLPELPSALPGQCSAGKMKRSDSQFSPLHGEGNRSRKGKGNDTNRIKPFPNSLSEKGHGKDGFNRKADRLGNYTWLTVSVGSQDKVGPAEIIALINRFTRGNSLEIGKIDISSKKSRFQVDPRVEDLLVSLLNKKNFKGKQIQVYGEGKRLSKKLPA